MSRHSGGLKLERGQDRLSRASDSDDEAELLRLQQEFLSGEQRPAAKVTRITRKTTPADTVAEPPHGPTEAQPGAPIDGSNSTNHDFSGLLPGMLGILTDVQERNVSGKVKPPSPPTSTEGAAFPKATHRRRSRFVLSRKQAPKSGGDPPNDPNAPTQAATASLYGPPARSTSLSTIPHINSPSLTVQSGSNGSKSAASSAASAATAAQESLASAAEGAASQHIEAQGMPMHVSAADQRHIHEENQQLLQSMSPAEVEEARQELLSRLTPKAQAFLAKRAAAKSASKNPTVTPRTATAGARSSAAVPQPAGAQNRKATAGNPAAAQALVPDPLAESDKHGTQQRSAAKEAERIESSADAACKAGSMPGLPDSSHHLAARSDSAATSMPGGAESAHVNWLRFSLEGWVVGLSAHTNAGNGRDIDQQVVQRDILRQSEGSSPEGYTLQEACTLTRSSLSKQRVLALRILQAVLTKARPKTSHHNAHSRLQPPLTSLSSDLSNTGGSEAKPGWGAVWEYALQEVQVATVLRMLLDDAQTSVVTAAAQALAVLVGPGRQEVEAWEAADHNPATGWPALPWRHHARPHAVGAWTCTPLEQPRPPPPGPGLVEEQSHDDGRLAMMDPLIGLIGMKLLERISFLLRSPASTSATSPLLVILQTYARSGTDTARAVWQCPGMLKGLQGLLQGAAGSMSLAAGALTVVRLLASSSAQMLREVASSGVLVYAQRVLAVATASCEKSVGEHLECTSLQAEALHIWRMCADSDINLIHLDDAYASICRLFDCPTSSSSPQQQSHANSEGNIMLSEDSGAHETHVRDQLLSKAGQLLLKLQMHGSCQAFLLLGSMVHHAIRAAERAMLSPGSATALVNTALEWLRPEVVQTHIGSLSDGEGLRAATGGDKQGRAGPVAGPGPFCSALAAVLQFLEAHIQARQVTADIVAIQQAMIASGFFGISAHTANSPISTTFTALLAVVSRPDDQHLSDETHMADSELPCESTQARAQDSGSQLRACACELVLAVTVLGERLMQHQAVDSSCIGSMHKAIIQALSYQVLSAGPSFTGLVEIQPWTSTVMQHQAPQLRLLLHALENVPVSQLTAKESQLVLQTALALPTVLPPGAEAMALRALSTAFQAALLGPALAQACQALHSFQAGDSPLAMAAAGLAFEQMQSVHSRAPATAAVHRSTDGGALQNYDPATERLDLKHNLQNGQHALSSTSPSDGSISQQQQQDMTGLLYPLEPLPDQAICCKRLLQGYSAAWLGLVPAAPSLGLISAAAESAHSVSTLLHPVGSRLPLPMGYLLKEITQVPSAPQPDPTRPPATPRQGLQPIPEEVEAEAETAAASAEASAPPDESASLSLGCALLMQLGLEQNAELQLHNSMSTGDKIKHVMDLVFNPEAAATAGSEEEVWYHPVVRWSLAALLQRWYATDPDLSCISPDDAQKWTEHFAALSYGDSLFSLALSPFLSKLSSEHVQVSVLQTLADERCLHLMPPVEAALPNITAFCSDNVATAAVGQQQHLKAHLQKLLHELHQGSLLARCQASNSLIIHLKA